MSLSARRATRYGAETAGWILPGILLALMPKCPACVAGYIALATGLGVSFTAASYLRSGAMLLSLLLLAWLVFTRGRKSLKRLKRASGCQSQASGGGDGGGVACGCRPWNYPEQERH
jgi:hypothetical protein